MSSTSARVGQRRVDLNLSSDPQFKGQGTAAPEASTKQAEDIAPHLQSFHATTETTLLGVVEKIYIATSPDQKPATTHFKLRCRNRRRFRVRVRSETVFAFLQNLDRLDRNRVHNPDGFREKEPVQLVKKYLRLGRLIAVQGVYHTTNTTTKEHSIFDAHTIYLLHNSKGVAAVELGDGSEIDEQCDQFLFEEGHWWLNQIHGLGHTWLNWQFGDTTSFNYHQYTSHLGITGFPLKSRMQECATLSRLTYGLSSAYMLTGAERYLVAARAAVQYQREYFRSLSHDGQRIVWAFGKEGREIVFPSTSGDDQSTIPLYEQIYCLAGLAQYYRVTQEWEVLDDIRRTLNNFDALYRDTAKFTNGRIQYGGFFSHVDYATLHWDTEQLGINQRRKNWNSVGDHIPAYLLNVLLALEPLPKDTEPLVRQLCDWCHQTLRELCLIIVTHFPDSSRDIPYVRERFYRNWEPDLKWGWQQNRAIIGHNLKIAWNLCRVYAALESFKSFPAVPKMPADYPSDADLQKLVLQLAIKLGDDMAVHGLDGLRGGCFDAVEREPQNGMAIDFTWSSTKDFWQQEQAILAYLTLHAQTNESSYLTFARDCMAFWNLFFLDRDNGGVFFRVGENGMPEIRGAYGIKAGHAVSGYHAFELNFLAHVLIRAFVRREPFCLHFRPSLTGKGRVLNTMPDYLPPGQIQMSQVTVNGRRYPIADFARFQVSLENVEPSAQIVVEYQPK